MEGLEENKLNNLDLKGGGELEDLQQQTQQQVIEMNAQDLIEISPNLIKIASVRLDLYQVAEITLNLLKQEEVRKIIHQDKKKEGGYVS